MRNIWKSMQKSGIWTRIQHSETKPGVESSWSDMTLAQYLHFQPEIRSDRRRQAAEETRSVFDEATAAPRAAEQQRDRKRDGGRCRAVPGSRVSATTSGCFARVGAVLEESAEWCGSKWPFSLQSPQPGKLSGAQSRRETNRSSFTTA